MDPITAIALIVGAFATISVIGYKRNSPVKLSEHKRETILLKLDLIDVDMRIDLAERDIKKLDKMLKEESNFNDKNRVCELLESHKDRVDNLKEGRQVKKTLEKMIKNRDHEYLIMDAVTTA